MDREEEAKRIVAELYDRFRGSADGIIESVLGDQLSKEEREDLVQEGFCKLLKHGDNLIGRSGGEQFSYLCNTMQHLAVDEGRRRSREKHVSFSELLEYDELSDDALRVTSPEDLALTEEEREEAVKMLYCVLDKLPKRDQELLMGRYFHHMSDRNVGKLVGLKEPFVRVYMDRALKRAAKHYKAEMEKERKRQKQNIENDTPKE